MSQRRIRRIIATVVIILLSIFIIERIYNNRAEFQVIAEDASHYGIIEAKVETKLKIQDFDNLYDLLEENYPFFKVNKRLHGVDWLENKKQYKRLIRNTKNDAEFFVAMERILGDLNNGHVKILSGEDFKKTYMHYYEKYARYNDFRQLYRYEAITSPFILYRYNMDQGLDHVELYDKDNLITKILEQDQLAYMKIKSMAFHEKAAEDYVEIKDFLKDVEDYGKLIIDIRGNTGGNNKYWEDLVQLLIDQPLNMKYYTFFKNGHRRGNDTYKVDGVTTIDLLDEEILKGLPEEIGEDFTYFKNNSIRINPWEGSLDPLDNINFSGKIYLLVDENVFSASEAFASFAKDAGFATLVGGTTGGDRVFEEVPITYLLQSKFVVTYSREMGINADGTINMETKTIPHIQVDPTPNEDFNKDECIQAVIRD